MDEKLIHQAVEKTLAGGTPFPEIVRLLITAGVEYYHVDYVAMTETFYSVEGHVVSTPLPYQEMLPVAADFSAEKLRANILDSQQKNQHYRDFSRRAIEAGVQGYTAFLRGKRVTYVGRQGDQHTEWFPGAQPAVSAK